MAEKGKGNRVRVGLDTRQWSNTLARGGKAPRLITMAGVRTGITVDREIQWTDDGIGLAGSLMCLVDAVPRGMEVTYGARLDQEFPLAIRHSAFAGVHPTRLPLKPEAQA